MAACVPDILQLLCSENHTIVKNSTTTEAKEKMYVWQNLKTIKFDLTKLATERLLTTKLCTGWKISLPSHCEIRLVYLRLSLAFYQIFLLETDFWE